MFQDLVHALRLAPDKSSVNISSCSEDTSKEDVVNKEDVGTKDSVEEIVVEMKDVNLDQDEGRQGDGEEAVIDCDENATFGSKGKVLQNKAE